MKPSLERRYRVDVGDRVLTPTLEELREVYALVMSKDWEDLLAYIKEGHEHSISVRVEVDDREAVVATEQQTIKFLDHTTPRQDELLDDIERMVLRARHGV